MRYLVSYDITQTKRRTRLRKTLMQFGRPVQYSVFECDLAPRQLERMRKIIAAIMVRETDNVRIYPLCEKCCAFADVFGGKPIERNELSYVV